MRAWLAIGAVNGFLAVLAAALGAHALGGQLAGALPSVFEKAAHYHLIHALAIIGATLAGSQPGVGRRWAHGACALFLIGIVLFCGSLYIRGATGAHAVVVVTPFGGAAFLAGWLVLAVAAWRGGGSRP